MLEMDGVSMAKQTIAELLELIGHTTHYDHGAPPPTVNQYGGWGDPPLIITVTWNEPETTQLLIDNGAEVNAQGDLGETALHKAVGMGHTEVVRVLLKNGADPRIASVTGTTPIAYAHKPEIAEMLKNWKPQ